MTEASARTPGGVAWPDKLITQAEAFAKAASWPVCTRSWFSEADGPERGINLYCDKDRCGQSMGQLRRGDTVYNGSLDEMLSMVLRHMVMAHNVPLNTRGKAPDERVPGPPLTGPGRRRYG
jgi:hypothetical protein